MSGKRLLWVQGLLAFVGFLDATFLTIEHYMGLSLPCISGFACDLVTKSSYAMVGPVPLALLGSLFYLVFLSGTVYVVTSRDRSARKWLWRLSWVGLVVSAVLVSLQLFVIHAICIYCMGSAGTSTLLWVTSMWGARQLPLTVTEGEGSVE